MNTENVAFGIVVIAVCVCLFLLLREFFCWYWKINKIVSLLTDIRGLLSRNESS